MIRDALESDGRGPCHRYTFHGDLDRACTLDDISTGNKSGSCTTSRNSTFHHIEYELRQTLWYMNVLFAAH